MLSASKVRGVLLLLLIFGCMASACSSEAKMNTDARDAAQDEISFQEYLWEQHSLDLLIQIALLLAGALGVVELLPAADEK